jgi:predicted molibdopterin-dependent oxidoreductase YjgC
VQAAACVAQCSDGMVVQTNNEKVRRGRKVILEMLHSTIDLAEAPEIQAMMEQYEADPQRFDEGQRRTAPVYDDNPFYLRDYNQCINCWRCVQVCAEDAQYTFALTFDGRGFHTQISTFDNNRCRTPPASSAANVLVFAPPVRSNQKDKPFWRRG